MTTQDSSTNLSLFRAIIKFFLPNSQAIALAVILSVSFVLIYYLADLLMPVFVSIVLAYLLESLVGKLEGLALSRSTSVYLVFLSFIAGLTFLLFYLLPLVSEQAIELIQQIPNIIRRVQLEISRLPAKYPQFISESRIQNLFLVLQTELLNYSQNLLSLSAASVVGLVSVMIYLFLVPMLLFFFLKDKALLLSWFLQFLPKDRNLAVHVWEEINRQIANYVRGKFIEVFILWLTSYLIYAAMGLNYAMLLAVFMGLQVIIPYVGATLVTFPVLGVAYFQWGFDGNQFMYVLIAYSLIQAIDGVVLVPVLFSEAVNLHAVAIIIAILFFGGVWGFWGVFLAIPLATVVKAVLNAWPREGHDSAFHYSTLP